jgi:hypothetical protein
MKVYAVFAGSIHEGVSLRYLFSDKDLAIHTAEKMFEIQKKLQRGRWKDNKQMREAMQWKKDERQEYWRPSLLESWSNSLYTIYVEEETTLNEVPDLSEEHSL